MARMEGRETSEETAAVDQSRGCGDGEKCLDCTVWEVEPSRLDVGYEQEKSRTTLGFLA